MNFVHPKNRMNILLKLLGFSLFSLTFSSIHSYANSLVKSRQQFEESLIKSDFLLLNQPIAPAEVTLYNLNPYINKWFLLEIRGERTYRIHVENRNSQNRLSLFGNGIKIENSVTQHIHECSLWSQTKIDFLSINFKEYKNPYFPLCNGNLYIRLKRSSKTRLSLTEWSTEILRKSDFGEDIINSVKPILVGMNAETAKKVYMKKAEQKKDHIGPLFAKAKKSDLGLISSNSHQLGIAVKQKYDLTNMQYGSWYQTKMHQGVYTSLYIPELIPKKILGTYKHKVFPISAEEKDKMIYLVAYDLSKFTIRYAVGTTQPGINASVESYGRTAQMRKSLISIGNIPPYDLKKSIGVFVGGFKSRHGKIRVGPHKGKRYGYIENGVELEPLSADLATIYVSKSGKINIGKWPRSLKDQKNLRKEVIGARQNGTLLLNQGRPGQFVNHWYYGNWSASADGIRASLRSGVCLQKFKDKEYLIFMAFTAATPSTMTRVMQAYSCTTGMHLDMNAHMYLHNAIYQVREDNSIKVEYLNKEMLFPPNLKRHRFILDNNRRDFFYVLKKSQNEPNKLVNFEKGTKPQQNPENESESDSEATKTM